ncbi:MAG: FAD binding domain-containing protein [Zhaonellaceae bacterium]
MNWEYKVPSSVREALEILGSCQGKARIIAGGTDLLVDLWNDKKTAECLVDITRIKELKEISLQDNSIFIGAGVTFQDVASNRLIWEKATALAEAASLMGSPQIRNTATIVGNVVNAQPAADAAVALMALDAELEIATLEGLQTKKLEDCYLSLGESAIDSTSQLVTGIRFPIANDRLGSAFARFALRKSLALPVLNVAVVLELDKDIIEASRLVIAPAGVKPYRAKEAEALLTKQFPEKDLFQKAAQKASAEAPIRSSSLRGGEEYRRHLAGVLLQEALNKSLARAKGLDQAEVNIHAKDNS